MIVFFEPTITKSADKKHSSFSRVEATELGSAQWGQFDRTDVALIICLHTYTTVPAVVYVQSTCFIML